LGIEVDDAWELVEITLETLRYSESIASGDHCKADMTRIKEFIQAVNKQAQGSKGGSTLTS